MSASKRQRFRREDGRISSGANVHSKLPHQLPHQNALNDEWHRASRFTAMRRINSLLTQNPKMRQRESWVWRPDVVLWTEAEGGRMPRKGHSEEQIIHALREAEAGKKVGDICRELGVSPQAFYSWKRRYAGLGLSELRELRQLREENRKLKTVVADLTLDKHILQEVLSKKA
jgi:putative transposase